MPLSRVQRSQRAVSMTVLRNAASASVSVEAAAAASLAADRHDRRSSLMGGDTATF